MYEILANLDKEKVESWFAANAGDIRPFFYSSVDIRNSGFKIAHVDTNIFPAGFNLLGQKAKERASAEIKKYFDEYFPNCKIVGLISENFSRNEHYWDNITALKHSIEKAGKQVSVGITGEFSSEKELPFAVHSTYKKDGLVYFGETAPCVVIANRDFTSGAPDELVDIKQPVIPPVKMGWYRRKKSKHFQAYEEISRQFAADFKLDPWLISTFSVNCGKVDFKQKEGLECIAVRTEKLLHKIRRKYDEYGIKEEAYVFVKPNSGTFGMGITTLRSGEEILEINKKLRNKMAFIKDQKANTEVIIQEGLPTIDMVDGKPAEPFVYSIGNNPVGANYRINEKRDRLGNLNSAGMSFQEIDCEALHEFCGTSPIGIISRLAGLAALKESVQLKDVG